MRVGPLRRPLSMTRLYVPRHETEPVLQRFDPFALEAPCQARGPRGSCGGRYGVYSGDKSTHCQRCGAAVPAPRPATYQVGQR